MKTKIKYILRNNKKYYAFEANGYHFKTKEEIRKEIEEINKKYSNEIKNVEKRIKEDFNFTMKQSDDVISLFRKYYGLDLYDLDESDYFNNPNKYLKSFNNNEMKEIQKLMKKKKLSFYTNFYIMGGIKTLNIKKIKKELNEKTNKYGFLNIYNNEDIIWIEKIIDIIHKIFGDKPKFYRSKFIEGKIREEYIIIN